MYKNNFTESQSFFQKYMRQAVQDKKKQNSDTPIRCQRCLKYGHLTYECKNDVAYLYRPSRTMQFKEKHLQYQLNDEKPPETVEAFDGDWKRTLRKKPELDVVLTSSDEEEQKPKPQQQQKQKKSSSSSSSSSSNSSDESSQSSSEEERSKSRDKEKQKQKQKSKKQKK